MRSSWFVVLLAATGCGRIGFDGLGGGDGDGGTGDGIDATPGAWLEGYGYRKRIDVNLGNTVELRNFPVSIFTSDSDIVTHGQVDGSDLVFTSADGTTQLPTELAELAGGSLEAWVRVPVLTSPTTLYAYYGGPASTMRSGVWGDRFAGVWHMSMGTGQAFDSKAGHTASNSLISERPIIGLGVSGTSADYDGNDDAIDAGDPADGSLDFGLESFSYSVWVRQIQTSGEFDVVLHKGGNGAGQTGYDMELGDNAWQSQIADSTSVSIVPYGQAAELLNRWVHLVTTLERLVPPTSAVHRVFVDGVQVDARLVTLDSVDTNLAFELGRGVDHYRGLLDEVHVYRGMLEPEWIAAEFTNLSPATRSTAIVVGAEQVR